MGWVTRSYDPRDTVSRFNGYTYTSDGLIATITNRRGQRVTMKYDALRRPIQIRDSLAGPDSIEVFRYSDPPSTVWFSDSNALVVNRYYINRTGTTDSAVTIFLDDSVNHAPIKYVRNYSWWSGQQTYDSITTNATGITFHPRRYYVSNNTGLLDSIRVGSQMIKLAHNSEQFNYQRTFPNNITATDSLSAAHLLVGTTYNLANTMLNRAYYYDSAGRVTQVVSNTASPQYVRQMGYDRLGNLNWDQQDTVTSTLQCLHYAPDYGCYSVTGTHEQHAYSYLYDATRNIVQQIDSTLNNTVTPLYVPGNRDSTWGSVTFHSDSDGNRVLKATPGDTIRYLWTARGALRKVMAPGDTIVYDYDAAGQLVRRSRHGAVDRHFLWDSELLLAELDGTANTRVAEYAYYPNSIDSPLAMSWGAPTDTTLQFFDLDVTGNVVGVFGTVLGSNLVFEGLQYNPGGSLETMTYNYNNDTTRLRWKGLLWEGDSTRLYYMRSRWYDPQSRRFLSEDPLSIAASLNAYVFGNSDPVNSSDPSGACPALDGGADSADGSYFTIGSIPFMCGGDGIWHARFQLPADTIWGTQNPITPLSPWETVPIIPLLPITAPELGIFVKKYASCGADYYGLTALAAGGAALTAPISMKPFSQGGSRGTSLASEALRKLFPGNMPVLTSDAGWGYRYAKRYWAPTLAKPLSFTRHVGALAGRWLGVAGLALDAYDGYKIMSCVVTQ